MGRTLKNFTLENVDDFAVAPHRYRWDRDDVDTAITYSDWKKAVPYQPGEVVYAEEFGLPLRYKIVDIDMSHDRHGERVAKFKAQVETQKGFFSKNFTYIFPGQIQRGYAAMGLAPEMPKVEKR